MQVMLESLPMEISEMGVPFLRDPMFVALKGIPRITTYVCLLSFCRGAF